MWKWMPLSFGRLPPVLDATSLADDDIVASPEWFGDGMRAFRQVLVRRELAELLRNVSPRDFELEEVDVTFEPEGPSRSELTRTCRGSRGQSRSRRRRSACKRSRR